jgi:diguanylate cyclase (GGDEF)-like protein
MAVVWALAAFATVVPALLAAALWRTRRLLALHRRGTVAQPGDGGGRDPLTGLVTRPEFEATLDEAALGSDHSGKPLALMYVGLDNFRPLNDGYGHRVGDAVLRQAAGRLSACSGPPLALSRIGGDEFALLLALAPEPAGEAARCMLKALQKPFEVEGLTLQLSASIGIALYPEHGSRPRLLGRAAQAMRTVKLVGGGGHALYDPSMAVDQRGQAELLQDLQHAVERGELQLYYQPKIDARSLQVTAAEALLRWQHPRRGTIAPGIFIPLAERHGLIAPIGRWVIEEACRQAAQWRSRGLRMRVAVNISGHQLRQDDLVQYIEGQLRRHGIPPGRLTCEITETVAMEDTAQTRRAFEQLRRAGLHVSIDDFGTGHSSLATLRRIPAAELKIDRAFVADLASGERARSIVQAIVHMARRLDLRVVAEGVETEAQRDALVALGCDELQGYLFAKPMTATSLALWADQDEDGGPDRTTMFRASLFDPTAAVPLDDPMEPAQRGQMR